jgi:hypothetical protein
MNRYRIYTENKNFDDVVDQTNKIFPDGATIYNAIDVWNGTREKSLVVETLSAHDEMEKVRTFTIWLKKHNDQRYVLATCDVVEIVVKPTV